MREGNETAAFFFSFRRDGGKTKPEHQLALPPLSARSYSKFLCNFQQARTRRPRTYRRRVEREKKEEEEEKERRQQEERREGEADHPSSAANDEEKTKQINSSTHEVDADRRDVRLGVRVVGEAEQQARFADARVADEQELFVCF